MTKHQMSAEVFVVASLRKEKRTAWPVLFMKRKSDIWYFVIGLSNEKDICQHFIEKKICDKMAHKQKGLFENYHSVQIGFSPTLALYLSQ